MWPHVTYNVQNARKPDANAAVLVTMSIFALMAEIESGDAALVPAAVRPAGRLPHQGAAWLASAHEGLSRYVTLRFAWLAHACALSLARSRYDGKMVHG